MAEELQSPKPNERRNDPEPGSEGIEAKVGASDQYSELFAHHLELNSHRKLVTHIKFDPGYQRLVTGSTDHTVAFYDIHNMKPDMEPIRTLEPIESQVVQAFDFNKSGDKLLLCSGGAKPKLLSSDGKELIEFMKGDMYIRDLLYTKGHTAGTTDCCFDRVQDHICYTSSMDGTVRVWDINSRPFGIEKQLTCKTIVKCKKANGQRAEVNRFLTDSEGMIIAMCEGGAIKVFSDKSYYGKPELELGGERLSTVTHAEFIQSPVTFATRELDNTVKLYDLRKFKEPVNVYEDLRNSCQYSGFALSEDKKTMVLGTSATRDESSELVVLDLATNEEVHRQEVGSSHVTYLNWSHKRQNLYVGVGSAVRVFYGAKDLGIERCLARQAKKTKAEDLIDTRPIFVPNALPMFRDEHNTKRKRFDKIRQDDKLTKKPREMLTGPGYGGMISGPRTTIQNVMKNIHEIKGARIDPLDRLKQLAEVSEANPQFVETAYQFTQPKKILDYESQEADEQRLMAMFKKCKRCGLKICHCIDYTKK